MFQPRRGDALAKRRRRLRLEVLSPRLLLAGDLGEGELYTPWHRVDAPEDVNGDGVVNTSDLLSIISDLTQNGSRRVDPLQAPPRGLYLDVEPDNIINPRDALQVLTTLTQIAGRAASSGPFPAE